MCGLAAVLPHVQVSWLLSICLGVTELTSLSLVLCGYKAVMAGPQSSEPNLFPLL